MSRSNTGSLNARRVFCGAAYESIGDYEQSVGGRTAAVALGNNLVLRVGFVTRF